MVFKPVCTSLPTPVRPRIKYGAGSEGEGAVDWYSRCPHTSSYPCEPVKGEGVCISHTVVPAEAGTQRVSFDRLRTNELLV